MISTSRNAENIIIEMARKTGVIRARDLGDVVEFVE
jgi:hypothetical protein